MMLNVHHGGVYPVEAIVEDYFGLNISKNWVKLPARQLLHGVTAVRMPGKYVVLRTKLSILIRCFTCAYIGSAWLLNQRMGKAKPVYVPISQNLATAIKDFSVLQIQKTRKVSEIAIASSIQDLDVDMSPHAMAV
eukprot:5359954-Amphidinium_carterae.1